MQYQVIIFDLDGLLIDSEVIYHRVSHELARLLGRKHRGEISAMQMGRTPLGSPHLLAAEALDLLGITDYFDLIVTSDQITRGKPDPEIYLRIANSLKIEPGNCIVLEDSSNGARSGCLAGCYVIAVPNAHTQQQDFTCVQARAANLYEAADMIALLNGIP